MKKDETPTAWDGDVPLRGPDAPKNDGSLLHLLRYLLTVYERFGNTTITEDIQLQWGATALHKRDEQKKRIAELEARLAVPEERAIKIPPEGCKSLAFRISVVYSSWGCDCGANNLSPNCRRATPSPLLAHQEKK